jgi:MraZ protein
MNFRGHFDYSLDAKNRLNVPPRFRAAFVAGVVLSPELDPCVGIWAPDGFEQFTAAFLAPLNPISPERRKLERFFGRSFDTELDAGGRVTLPQKLLQHAGIGREVAVIGRFDHLEVWDRGRWESYEPELEADVPRIAEGVGHAS